jgi:hypothetical protein
MQGVYRVNTRSIDSTLCHDAEQDGMRVAIYARLSKDTSGVSENVEIQIQETKAYARSMGYRIAGIFSDNDISASKYSKKPRPGYRHGQCLKARLRTSRQSSAVCNPMVRQPVSSLRGQAFVRHGTRGRFGGVGCFLPVQFRE